MRICQLQDRRRCAWWGDSIDGGACVSSAHFRALCSSPQQRKTCPSSLAAPHLHSAPPPVSLLLGPRAFLGMESVLSSYLGSTEVPGILPSQVTPSADKGWGLVHTHLSGPLSQDGSGVCRSHSSEGPSRAEPQPPMAVTSPIPASHPHLPRDLIPAPRDPFPNKLSAQLLSQGLPHGNPD